MILPVLILPAQAQRFISYLYEVGASNYYCEKEDNQIVSWYMDVIFYCSSDFGNALISGYSDSAI